MKTNCQNRYVLEAIDPATASISHELQFDATDTAELCSILGITAADFRSHASYPLEASTVSRFKDHYGLKFDDTGFEVRVRAHNPNDDLPYKIHDGRELAMMLAKTKPLANFIDDYPKHHDLDIIPEREFEPHVKAGRIIKREHISLPGADAAVINGERIGSRRVLYALAGQEWRIDAYLRLWETAKKTSWTEQLEREEGTLLGYEDWQNDIHMMGWRKPPPQIPGP
jgi:hypothetical protein